ncbi:MAG: hypothetical protein JEZ09_09895 [Salinivirgaceae bacterium]|nr:hypothetical protein [Salinivirgaceae bacterium]
MKWINKIAYNRNIRNETPNKELAKELADTNNREGIREISEYLYDKNKSISSDCLSVLYTIGYSEPNLIQDYIDDFLKLLESKNNRMVWGSMIALSTIAQLKSDYLFAKMNLIFQTMKKGTLITEVWGIKTVVNLSIVNREYKNKLLPVLFDYLEKCRPIDFATRIETILPVIESPSENEILDRILEIKSAELSDSGLLPYKSDFLIDC